jgi:hypothetical protein
VETEEPDTENASGIPSPSRVRVHVVFRHCGSHRQLFYDYPPNFLEYKVVATEDVDDDMLSRLWTNNVSGSNQVVGRVLIISYFLDHIWRAM